MYYSIGSKKFHHSFVMSVQYLSKARRYLNQQYFAKMLLPTVTNQPSMGSIGGTYLMSKLNT